MSKRLHKTQKGYGYFVYRTIYGTVLYETTRVQDWTAPRGVVCARRRRRLGVHGAAAATERLCAGDTREGETLFCRDGERRGTSVLECRLVHKNILYNMEHGVRDHRESKVHGLHVLR